MHQRGVVRKGDPFFALLLGGLCVCFVRSILVLSFFFSQTMDNMFGETIVLGHCDYLVPFLFFRFFHDGHFGHPVDMKDDGC